MDRHTVVTDDRESSNEARTGAGPTAGPVRAWAMLFLVLAARVYRAFLLTLVAVALVPMLWSWTSYVVGSGSMEPALSVGDVVVATPLSANERVPTGRVMAFSDPARDRTLVHRVVERLADGTFITAGDANATTDSTPVPRKNFIARGTLCIPYVALPVVWLRTHDLVPLIIWSIITAGAIYFASRRHRPPRHRRPLPDDRDPRTGLSPKSMLVARVSAVIAGAVLLVVGVMLAPVEPADAAFSARTTNAASTWKVAVNSSKATSSIQVYDTPSTSGWYQRSQVSVNISATAAAGASVRSITYRVNGGSAVTINSSSIVFVLATQGDNTITYFATDNRGAAESTHTAHIKLDYQAPTLTVTSQLGDMSHAQWRLTCSRPGSTGGVCGAVSDVPGSGVASVTYVLRRSSDQSCFDGAIWTGAACTNRPAAIVTAGSWVALIPDALLEIPRAWYTITIFTTDIAGNEYNTTRSFSVG